MKTSKDRSLAKLKYNIEYQLLGHILNPLWKSRDERRYRRFEVKNKATLRYFSQFDGFLRCITPPVPDDLTVEPTRIFSIWFQGEEHAPECVKACFDSMRRHLTQDLVVLDSQTIFDWISLPDDLVTKWEQGKIGMAHFSDICRVELLFQHGGMWFDATDYVTGPVSKDIMESDFFVFMAGSRIRSWYAYIQNCFIRAKKGNPLLGLWREAIFEYWRYEDRIINYYGHQILFQHLTEINSYARELFAVMPHKEQDPTHVLWYGHKDDPYDEALYKEYVSGAFFQKTDFKDPSAKNPLSGSMAAFMFNQTISD